MDGKIVLQINDASVINEAWLKEEGFQIAVKHAICEGIARKATKLINISPDFQALYSEVGKSIRNEFEEKMLEKRNWDYLLKDTYRKQIDNAIEASFSSIIRKKIEEKADEMIGSIEKEMRAKLKSYKDNFEDWLERNDPERIFREECSKYISKKFNQ